MRGATVCILLLFAALCNSVAQQISYVGRVQQSAASPSAVEFEWSNVEIHVSFKGSAVEAFLDSNLNVFQVFVDGVSTGLINTTTSMDRYLVASGLSAGKQHTVVLRKITEALFGVVTFHGFAIAGDFETPTIIPATATLQQRSFVERRIEFVGDSISCGYGIEGHPPCPFSPATQNSALTYGSIIAQSLSAQLHLECWSGKGVVRNYGDHNITSAVPFPHLFPLTLPTNKDSLWHFGLWTPQAVVINLGTNDYSTQPSPPQELFENGYIRFVDFIHSQYEGTNHTPHFFLVCGPMISQPCCSYVKNVVDKQKAKGINITYIDLQHILGPDDYGCAGHPSVSGHKKMASIAGPIIQREMSW